MPGYKITKKDCFTGHILFLICIDSIIGMKIPLSPRTILTLTLPVFLFSSGVDLMAENPEERGITGFQSGVLYNSLRNNEFDLKSFSIPIALPLETTINDLRLHSSIQYTQNEYRINNKTGTVKGASYLSIGGDFHPLKSDDFQLFFSESISIPLDKRSHEDVPREAWLNHGGYKIDTQLSFSYFFQRSSLKFSIEHIWNLAKNDFNKGETLKASIIFGYGLESLTPANYNHFGLSLGLKSKYQYKDQISNEVVPNTEYGTLFLSPGLSFLTDSLVIKAHVDVPVKKFRGGDNSFDFGTQGSIGIEYHIK